MDKIGSETDQHDLEDDIDCSNYLPPDQLQKRQRYAESKDQASPTILVHLAAISGHGWLSSQFTATMKDDTTAHKVDSPNVAHDALLWNLFGVRRRKRKTRLHLDR